MRQPAAGCGASAVGARGRQSAIVAVEWVKRHERTGHPRLAKSLLFCWSYPLVKDASRFLAVLLLAAPSLLARAGIGQNDLAVLKVEGDTETPATFRPTKARQGERVMVYGFPLVDILASSGNATVGNITALAGFGDDSRLLQISAPVQPGNSGGPLIDENGYVVGVIVAKLNAIAISKLTGDIPQNINFAIKSSVVLTFLDVQGIRYRAATQQRPTAPSELADIGRSFTVQVGCNQ